MNESTTRLSVSQIATKIKAELGISVSVDSVRAWTVDGVRGRKLKSSFVGGQRFISWSDFMAFHEAINSEAGTNPIIATVPDLSGLGGFGPSGQPMM